MARAMILAAGLGTRLRPLTDELPKPLVPLGDRPFVAHLLSRLRDSGFDEVVLNAHHRADELINFIHPFVGKLHVTREEKILGTAGGISGARRLLGPAPVLVWNGDVLVAPPGPPIPALLDAAREGGLVLAAIPRRVGEGTLGVDAGGAVARLRGERFGTEVTGADYVGVAALGQRTLDTLPAEGCLFGDVALPGLRSGAPVRVVTFDGSFTDIGTPAAYHAANLAWLAGAASGPGGWVHPDAIVGPDVVLNQCVVGKGATVSGSGRVERCVVWPGASLKAPLCDAIVTTAGRVVPVVAPERAGS